MKPVASRVRKRAGDTDIHLGSRRGLARFSTFAMTLSERNRNAIDQVKFELKSLILAQIERWRHALHMQVERERGQPRVEWRTGE